jgi:hypothetical protein
MRLVVVAPELRATLAEPQEHTVEEPYLHARFERLDLVWLVRALLGGPLVDELPSPEPPHHPLLDARRNLRELLA